MEAEIKDLRREIAQIKIALKVMQETFFASKDPEGELTDWAKQELAEARVALESDFTSLDDFEKELENEL